ncbi:MAG TPA: polysaccharide biosynthesis C-terminal domain-containing protein [Candidatus Dormibacteraeota bacterium]|nr:polysaccharide biosynthesis C-terminal domain-containing protein [Candidatus Dormibacteraeota bacterium]
MTSPGALGRRRITADIAVQLVGKVANLALGVVVTVLLVRHLGERGFGEWSTLLAVTNLVVAAGSQTLLRVAVPRAAADHEREGAWMSALIGLQTLIAVPGALIALAVIAAISRGGDMRVAGVLIALTVLLNVPQALGAVFQLRVRNDLAMAVLTLNSLIWTGAVVAITSADGGLPALAAAFTGATLITSIATVVLAAPRVTFDWEAGRQLWAQIFKIAVPVGVFGIAVTAYNQVDQLIVFSIAGSKDAGLYGSVYRVLDQAGVFPAAVVTTLTPILASTYRTDLPRVHRLLQVAADNLGILSFGAIGIAIGAGKPILDLLYGEEFTQAAPALAILMVAFVVICLGYVFGSMVVILNVQRRLLRYALLALGVNIGLNLIFVSLFGYIAAACVTVITEVLILALTMHLVGPMIDFRLRYGRMARTVLAAALMAGILLLLDSIDTPVGLLVLAAAGSYTAFLFLFRAIHPGELYRLVTER